MMVLEFCENGNLRDHLKQSEYINFNQKVENLFDIISGLLNIHNANKVHKDFHSGNILYRRSSFSQSSSASYIVRIGDLGMCQPANNEQLVQEGIFGVLPYMAPEVLRGRQYTKAADVYSFGIIMNELLSEKIPYSNIPHDSNLAIKICKGLRPEISEDIPKLFVDLIIKCLDANAENRPTA
ncbi:kinase-like domain-containing protein, partial [Glomus cerebriforme]